MVQAHSPKEAVKMGKCLFLKPEKYLHIYLTKLSDQKRPTPIHIPYSYQQTDTIRYMIPEIYTIEKGLRIITLGTPYGHYYRAMKFLTILFL